MPYPYNKRKVAQTARELKRGIFILSLDQHDEATLADKLSKLLALAIRLEREIDEEATRLTTETISKLWAAHRLRRQSPPVPWAEIAATVDPGGQEPRSLERAYSLYRHVLHHLEWEEAHSAEGRQYVERVLQTPEEFVAHNEGLRSEAEYGFPGPGPDTDL